MSLLGVRDDGRVRDGGLELVDASLGGFLGQVGLRVGGEELPRRRSSPFLAHEQHRRERAGQREDGGYRQLSRVEGRRQSVAGCPVADLVVVLVGDDETPGRGAVDVDRVAVPAAPERRVRAVVVEASGQHLGECVEVLEVCVVTGELPVNATWTAWWKSSLH